MNKLLVSALLAISFNSSAFADTVTFNVAPNSAVGSASGFTFIGNWRGGDGAGGNTAPFMDNYFQAHSISYDAGSFNFTGMSLSQCPWPGYWEGWGNLLSFDFKDITGGIISSGNISLSMNDSFQSYSQQVNGVHEIYFYATNGFWPRLASIDMNVTAAVPEPENYAMLLAGLGVLGAMSGRKKIQAKQPHALA
jgi:hypothetical protein